MKVFCLLLLAFLSVTAWGQEPNFAELLRQLSHSKKDTTIVRNLMGLADRYTLSNPDSGILIMNQAMIVSRQIGDSKDEMESKGILASYWWSVGDYATAARLFLELREHYKSINDSGNLSMINASLLNQYRDQGDYKEALKYSSENLTMFPGSNVATGMINAMAGSIYYDMGNQDSAAYFLRKSLTYPLNIGPGWILLMNGRVSAKQNHVPEALAFYRKALVQLEKESNLKDIAQAYNSLGELYLGIGNTDSAIYYGRQGLTIGQQRKFRKEVVQSCQLLSKIYEKQDIKTAYAYFRLGAAIKDSLYSQDKQRELLSYKFNEQMRQTELSNVRREAASRSRIYLLLVVLVAVLMFSIFLIRNNRHKQKTNLLLKSQKNTLESTLRELKTAQAQVIQSEKMASLGEVTAGIAHEMQNPLNFVNNFSELNEDLLAEMKIAIKQQNLEEIEIIAVDLQSNSSKIHQHGKRAASIVKGMLTYSGKATREMDWVDINSLCSENLRLSYSDFREQRSKIDIDISTSFSPDLKMVMVNAVDLSKVLCHLFNNAFYELARKEEREMSDGREFNPALKVITSLSGNDAEVRVEDNGYGITEAIADKIFQPFFTTKPPGAGTGLGLSIVYDIVTKGRGGTIQVESNKGNGVAFLLRIPVAGRAT